MVSIPSSHIGWRTKYLVVPHADLPSSDPDTLARR